MCYSAKYGLSAVIFDALVKPLPNSSTYQQVKFQSFLEEHCTLTGISQLLRFAKYKIGLDQNKAFYYDNVIDYFVQLL